MNIPKFHVVDAVELAKELDNYHIEPDSNGNDDLIYDIYYELGGDQGYLEDHIRWPQDCTWDDLHEGLKQAYDYLVTMYGFQHGDSFLWYLSE